ncbi:GGDEF domain-containing protein [Alteriqipengyuania sp. 357]
MATNLAFEEIPPAESILQRMGLFGSRPHLASDAHDGAPSGVSKAERRARRRLLNDVRAFLIYHDLDITPSTLASAHETCSGLNPALNRAIEARVQAGLAVTAEWLEEAAAGAASANDRAVKKLADKLEHGIDELSRATQSARRATSEYGDELERHVDDLAGTRPTDDVIAGLADFAREMLARSRNTEEELRASERETARLRVNLDRARRDAEVDYLTGLPNRRAFETVLQDEHREAATQGRPLSVAFCDIDRFKGINDSHGHEAGDRIIRVVAQTLSNICGDDCYIARHGGEEFVLLFAGLGPAEALARLDLAREELADRRMINRRTDRPFGQVTFSGGIADVAQFQDPREGLAAADEALYCAKEGGRNRISLSSDCAAAA